MKVILNIKEKNCQVIKEQGDPRYTHGGWGDAESRFLYHVLKALKAQGYDVIKKRMWRDGHMVDSTQQYIRTREFLDTPKDAEGEFAIHSQGYALYDLGEEFNALKDGESLYLWVTT